jgi:hypothetical protein
VAVDQFGAREIEGKDAFVINHPGNTRPDINFL